MKKISHLMMNKMVDFYISTLVTHFLVGLSPSRLGKFIKTSI